MAQTTSALLKELQKIEKSVAESIKSRKISTGNVKDDFSDKLDDFKDKVENLKDAGKLDGKSLTQIKTSIKKVKSKLDVDFDD